MAFTWLLSANRKAINWRVIIWGTLLQLMLAFFIFIVPAGSGIFLFINDAVVKILESSTAGTRFLFGRLALPSGTINEAGEDSLGFILAFQALPTIIFFASLMAVYYAGNNAQTHIIILEGFYKADENKRGGIPKCIKQYLCGC